MAKLMLLGGSQGQLSAAVKAKEMGHTIVLADYLQNPPAAGICSVHERISSFDAQSCILAARKHHISGVFTVGSDQPVLTAAMVAQALHLPSPISIDTAYKATNKFKMKNAFQQFGIPTAPHRFLHRSDTEEVLSNLEAPFVIKPLDSQGQRGIFKLDTVSEVMSHLAETLSYSREDTALVESFYPSDEVTLSAFVSDGRVFPLALTDRQLLDDPLHIGICAAHRYPSVHANHTQKINTIAQSVAEALGVRQGPLYIQFLVGDSGVIVNEASARIGGAFEDVFIPWLTGFDILKAVIRMAAGETISTDVLNNIKQPLNTDQVSVQLLFCRPGKIASVTPVETLLSLPGVLAAGYNYSEGCVIPAAENATARFGHCVLTSHGRDIHTLVSNLYHTLHVLNSDGHNMVIPRTYDGKGILE